MLRGPQHERRNINDINIPPFVTSINSVQALSTVEGLLGVFHQPLSESVLNVRTIIFIAGDGADAKQPWPGEEHQ
jgi:hypothetical protein